MESKIYHFEFDDSVPMEEAESTLHLAIMAAECVFGEPAVRMDAAYSIHEQNRVCVVDASHEVGRCICKVFTGYLVKEFGADSFTVRRIKTASSTRQEGKAA